MPRNKVRRTATDLIGPRNKIRAFTPTESTGTSGPAAGGSSGFFALDGFDGMDGDAGLPGLQGPAGPAGTGAPGPPGVGVPGIDGDDGQDGFAGAQGSNGAPGAVGAQGSAGAPGPPGMDGDDAEPPMMIQGPPGVLKVFQTEVDFGATPVNDALFVVADANVIVTSRLLASVAYEAPTGKDLDELEMDAIDVKVAPGAGQFTLYMRGLEGDLADKFKVNYVIGG